MGEKSKLFTYAIDTISACLLPELAYDLGNVMIEGKQFDEFRRFLDANLVILFDFLRDHEYILYDDEVHREKIGYKFVILLCEQTASRTYYQVENQNLLDNLTKLQCKHFKSLTESSTEITKLIFEYYTTRLTTDGWKRNLGALHGFQNFLHLYYIENNNVMDLKWSRFCLSVGLLLQEYFETTYKVLGFKIFYIMLKSTNNEDLTTFNLHGVIYEACLRNLQIFNEEANINILLECLLCCIKTFSGLEFSKWNKIDDLLQELFRKIAFVSETSICSRIFFFIAKLVAEISYPKYDWSQFTDCQSLQIKYDVAVVRRICQHINPKPIYRFAKRLLQLFTSESYRLRLHDKLSLELLESMHFCYIVCIYPLSMSIVRIHLLEFLQKFPTAVFESYIISKDHIRWKKTTLNFMETFLLQLNNDTKCLEKMENMKDSLEKILKHKIFL